MSSAYERCSRLHLLDWAHHQEVANHDQAADLLAWAEETGATVKQLREEKQRRSASAAPVAAAFPEFCTRVQELGWHHHKEVANHPQSASKPRLPAPVWTA